MTDNVSALCEVANFVTLNFLSKIKFLARNKRDFTTKFAILQNACWQSGLYINSLNLLFIFVSAFRTNFLSSLTFSVYFVMWVFTNSS